MTERKRLYMIQYRKVQQVRLAEQRKAWNAAHKTQEAESHKAWLQANPERVTYHSMLRRCNNPSQQNYPRYGGLGIRVADKSFDEFYQDVGPKPGRAYSIDRINPYGHYAPGNCRWATAKEQRRNQRSVMV